MLLGGFIVNEENYLGCEKRLPSGVIATTLDISIPENMKFRAGNNFTGTPFEITIESSSRNTFFSASCSAKSVCSGYFSIFKCDKIWAKVAKIFFDAGKEALYNCCTTIPDLSIPVK